MGLMSAGFDPTSSHTCIKCADRDAITTTKEKLKDQSVEVFSYQAKVGDFQLGKKLSTNLKFNLIKKISTLS